MSNSLVKKLFALLLVSLIVLIGFISFKYFYKGTIEVVIENNNPITNMVTINDQKVFPTGEGGKIYKVSMTPSEELNLKISGPKIKTIEENLELSLQENLQLKYSVEPSSAASILESLDKQVSSESINEAEYFGDSDEWLVVFIDQGSGSLFSETCILNFSLEAFDWVIVECGERVSAGNPLLINSPELLKMYLDENSDD